MSVTYSEPGIFNVLDPWVEYSSEYAGMVAGSADYAPRNTAVLQGIIELAQAYSSDGKCPSGSDFAATILFPGHSIVPEPIDNESGATDEGAEYFLQVPSGQTAAILINCNWPLLFKGTGNVKLTLVVASDSAGDMFAIQSNVGADHDVGGITFQGFNLHI